MQRPAAAFSDPPTESELTGARLFHEPLLPLGAVPGPAENRALAGALRSFQASDPARDPSRLVAFLKAHPASSWAPSLHLNLGLHYSRAGLFTRALESWRECWTLARNMSGSRAKLIAGAAAGNLAQLLATFGRRDELDAFLRETAGFNFHGPATSQIEEARSALAMLKLSPEQFSSCGADAASQVQSLLIPSKGAYAPRVVSTPASDKGYSLAEVNTLCNRLNLDYQMARRQPGAPVIVPAIMHWNLGHYSALVRSTATNCTLNDPQLGGMLVLDQKALDAEASGYFVVPAGDLPAGWSPVSSQTAKTITGRGFTIGPDPDGTTQCDPIEPPCTSDDPDPPPMARYAFHVMMASLHISDTPLRYAPPRGPGVSFQVSYNQREHETETSLRRSNLGFKWNFNWISWIVPDSGSTPANISYHPPGGGADPFAGPGGTNIFTSQREPGVRLVKLADAHYELQLPEGGKRIFKQVDSSSQPVKLFLSVVLDGAGNGLTNLYDSNSRLVGVVDSLGRTNVLGYGSQILNDPAFYLITAVTNPFGRYATFDYEHQPTQDSPLCLVRITDMIGIQSAFTYTNNDFISSLITPYGTNRFTTGTATNVTGTGPENALGSRWVEATDPLGQRERVEHCDRPEVPQGVAMNSWPNSAVPIYDPPAQVPAGDLGFRAANTNLNYRNSFYWGKAAMAQRPVSQPPDPNAARIYHFVHHSLVGPARTGRALESIKAPLEGRTWFNYDGQTFQGVDPTVYAGTNDAPSKVARVLDDGSTQLYQYEYNIARLKTKEIDPAGRARIYVYNATNLIDLLEVRQQAGAATELLAAFTYNTNHQVLTATDAAGHTTACVYTNFGQLAWISNGLGQVHNVYDADGRLLSINRYTNGMDTGGAPWSATGFTYDSCDRVRTVTAPDGYAVTFDYDAADRVTNVFYPDNTSSTVVYRYLDPVLTKDRRGHWSATYYDAMRRVTDVQDAAGRNTHFEWCACGALESITDPLGRTTTWIRDLAGRPYQKVFPDQTRLTYEYEARSSRLKTVTDAMNQLVCYRYNVDDTLHSLSYSNAAIPTPAVFYTYDSNHTWLTRMDSVDASGATNSTSCAYHAIAAGQPGAGRLQSMDGPLANDTITYAYDLLGRITNRAIDGVNLSAVFDTADRVAEVSSVLGQFSNQYLSNTLRLASVGYPSGQGVAFSYHGVTDDYRLKQITNFTASASLSAFDYAYDPEGQIKTWTQRTGAASSVWSLSYDPVDQLVGARITNGLTSALVKSFVYAYDPAGNRLAEEIDTALTAGQFNDVNQLTELVGGGRVRVSGVLTNKPGTVRVGGMPAAMGPGNTSFVAYAKAGLGTNYIPVVASDFAGRTATNLYRIVVTNAGVARTLAYDLNGNLVSVVTPVSASAYEWDAADRLASITQTGEGTNLSSSHFEYDGAGRRIRIVEMTNSTILSDKRFVWVGSELAEERTSAGAVTKRFFGAGEQIGGTNYYFTRDHLGSVREMTDSAGNLHARFDYDPYGRRTQTHGTLQADFGFTGHYVHAPTGLQLALYRAYDAETGRWLSRDPIGELRGVNLYDYVGNKPVNRTDPLGLWGIQFGDFNIGYGDPSYVFDREVWGGIKDSWHAGLDAIGTIEPTPFADSLNGMLYGLEGDWGNAGISAAGMVPYLGDSAKLGKYGAKLCKAAEDIAKKFKRLSPGEIKKLLKSDIDPHDLKPNSKYDLFKDEKGNIFVKPKDGSGPGDPTGININDF